MEKIYQEYANMKKSGITNLLLLRVDFRAKSIK